ncbi:hypothetical protein [Flavobacterium flavigenum]|uniref:hypothetical protein n=1 Tax=Flavobacterium flavigenum TaxID=3003258 RepID=UPI0024830CC3|nr:hypothetical protein [Flavobacterium flavigenum]
MTQKIILALLLFSAIGCKSQEKKGNITTQQKDSMEQFDIKKYEKLEKDNKYESKENDVFYRSDITRYRIIFQDVIQVEERKVDSPYKLYKIYFKNTFNLKGIEKTFYGFSIGITKEYDENGELIKETNYDLLYKFSIEDLREKIKREYKVDIVSDYKDSDPTLIIVNRWEGYHSDGGIYKKGVPMYQLKFSILNKGTVNLEINALNGETIMEMLNGKQIKP